MPRNPEVNFYLKPQTTGNGKDNKCVIYLQFKYNTNRLVYSFGERIAKKDWNDEKQRGKNKNILTQDGEHSLNQLLDGLKEVLESAFKKEKVNGIPTTETLRSYLIAFMNKNQDKPTGYNIYTLIDRFISGEIKFKGRNKSLNTLDTYKAVKKHMEAFEIKTKSRITFDSINLDFFYKYVSFLNGLGLATNTIAKDISVLKVFMSEAVDLGYTNNYQFKHKKFAVAEEDTDAVYLTEQELIRLYRHDMSSKKLEQARDLFIFGCFVGLRFSDYSDIKPDNIVLIDNEYFIKVRTKKTSELVIIPCNPIVLEIFEKYKLSPNKLPKSISNQKFNDYIKDALEEAKLTETGRLSTNPTLTLDKCVSSHTARRSFATNYYLQGFPTIDLMKITGHKTERAFLKYIRVSKLDSAKRLSAHMKIKWAEKILRVA